MTNTAPQVTPADGPYPVEKKRTHIRLHGDEALANEIGIKFGADKLPGFATAPFELVDSGLHLDEGKDGWRYLIEDRTATLGCYGGPFDEHADYEHTPDEFAKTNCALKMARFLGVAADPALQDILAYALKSDRSSHRGPFDIDPIIKEWWRMGCGLKEVLSMYHAIFEAWYHQFSGRAPVRKPDGTFRNAIARWMVNRFGAQNNLEDLLERLKTGKQVAEKLKLRDNAGMSQTFNLDLRRGGKTPFDLEGVWDALWAAGTPAETIEHIMMTSLEAKYQGQVEFREAEDEFVAFVQYPTVNSEKRHPYKVAVIHSDSDYINRAARKVDPDTDVLIMHLQDGHTRIFSLHKRLDINPIAARLREAEILKTDGRHGLRWSALESKGTLAEIPEWYSSHDNLGVFNSTETSPDTPVSVLGAKSTLSIVNEGLAHAWTAHRVEPAKSRNAFVSRAKEFRRKRKDERQVTT